MRRGHTSLIKPVSSLSVILFGMFLIMTVVRVSSPCSILWMSSWLFSGGEREAVGKVGIGSWFHGCPYEGI